MALSTDYGRSFPIEHKHSSIHQAKKIRDLLRDERFYYHTVQTVSISAGQGGVPNGVTREEMEEPADGRSNHYVMICQ